MTISLHDELKGKANTKNQPKSIFLVMTLSCGKKAKFLNNSDTMFSIKNKGLI
jgi:hypothetical protein